MRKLSWFFVIAFHTEMLWCIMCRSTAAWLECTILCGRTELVYAVYLTLPFLWKWLGLARETRTDTTRKGIKMVHWVGHGLPCVYLLSTRCYMTSPNLTSSPMQVLSKWDGLARLWLSKLWRSRLQGSINTSCLVLRTGQCYVHPHDTTFCLPDVTWHHYTWQGFQCFLCCAHRKCSNTGGSSYCSFKASCKIVFERVVWDYACASEIQIVLVSVAYVLYSWCCPGWLPVPPVSRCKQVHTVKI